MRDATRAQTKASAGKTSAADSDLVLDAVVTLPVVVVVVPAAGAVHRGSADAVPAVPQAPHVLRGGLAPPPLGDQPFCVQPCEQAESEQTTRPSQENLENWPVVFPRVYG